MDIKTHLENAGGQSEVARACSLTRQAIGQWVELNRLPYSEIAGRTRYAAIIAKMAQANGHDVTPLDICPGAPQYMPAPASEAA